MNYYSLLLYGIIALNNGRVVLLQGKNGASLGLPVCLACALVYAGKECVPYDAVCCPSLVTGGHSGWGAAAPRPCPSVHIRNVR